ncbi:hypothetical protein QFC20_007418 [Naganishia adeliensis]|uniref:Uncharacterized protein n=1 Tax=Naganishia adeliensis TaxID=92952 RepID=A0ACC2UYX5_9TREE|nr:hypothetical protein QFC20_007418 [Naganishia adeliensis]
MPLLIKSLQSYHAPNRLDSRIFIGMLLALVAGEKNLIIDVDVNELTTQFRHEGGRPLPFAKTLAQDGAGFGHKETLALAEIRVQAMVEYPSQKDVDWSRIQRPIPSKKDNEELPEDDRPGSPPAAGSFDGTFTVWPSNQTLADVTDTNSGVPSFSTTTSNSPYSETGLPSSPQQNVGMLPHVLVLTRLHKAHRSVQARIWDMIPDYDLLEGKGADSPAEHHGDRTNHVYEQDLPSGFFVIWIRLSGDKHKHVARSLLDRFALSCSADEWSEPHSEAALTGTTTATPRIDPILDSEISDIVTSLLSLPTLSVNLTSATVTDLKAFVRVSRVLFRPFTWRTELLNPEISGRQYDQRKKLQEALDQEECLRGVNLEEELASGA